MYGPTPKAETASPTQAKVVNDYQDNHLSKYFMAWIRSLLGDVSYKKALVRQKRHKHMFSHCLEKTISILVFEIVDLGGHDIKLCSALDTLNTQ